MDRAAGPSTRYELLWEERQLLSVANLTCKDGLDFLALADLRNGRFEGTAISANGASGSRTVGL
ncbi:MAG: hypothetical protein HKM03_06265 [Steroidobacteraceae bacterium]|nr:hypothetical protein [Steroidobacteraceae bacterium]